MTECLCVLAPSRRMLEEWIVWDILVCRCWRGVPGRGDSAGKGAKVENAEGVRGASVTILWLEQSTCKGERCGIRLG